MNTGRKDYTPPNASDKHPLTEEEFIEAMQHRITDADDDEEDRA